MKFYTNVSRKGNKIYERGYENGRAFRRKVKYRPYLFKYAEGGEYKTIKGQPCVKIDFEDMFAAGSFVKKYKDVAGISIYGLTNFEFVYIYDNYPSGFEYNFADLNIINTDIETSSEGGFPNIAEADKEINAITLAKGDKTITLGFKNFVTTKENQTYIQCENEEELLKNFIRLWNSTEWRPDIVTGWNIEFFDIPYLVNRINNILGEKWVKRLSPFRIVEEREVAQKNGKTGQSYSLFGIAVIDYYAAYKKFAAGERESYKLDFIAEYELGEKKVDYSEYGSLDNFYKENPQKFYEYNIHDAVLIGRLEKKLHYIEQIVSIAYIQRVNFENTLSTVKPWDVIVHNYLLDQKIVVPQYEDSESDFSIIGGFVKEPKPGLYEYVVSLDFTSLYPSLAMQYNISPDTFVRQLKDKPDIDQIINDDMTEFSEELKRRDITMTANGCFFKRNKRGFIPSIMKMYFEERKNVRKLESVAEKKYEASHDDADESNFLKYKNLQTAYKLINNSGFGAIANPYFRWFASYLAEAITASGQMTIQYVEKHLNIYLNDLFKTQDVDYVVYCDTDSAYVTLKHLIDKTSLKTPEEKIKGCVNFAKNKLVPFIDKICKELGDKLNSYEITTSMKVEKACDKAFFTGKKHYALNVLYSDGIYYSEPKVKVTGLETVRSSNPKKIRKALEQCYKIIFKGDEEGLVKYINDFKEEFRKMEFNDIAKPSGVKGIGTYYDRTNLVKLRCPIHVRGAIVFNEFLRKNKLEEKYEKIVDYDKIKFCYLKLPNPTHQNVIAFKDDPPPELDIRSFIDYDLQFDKTFLIPIKNVCDAIGWEVEKHYTLDDMF